MITLYVFLTFIVLVFSNPLIPRQASFQHVDNGKLLDMTKLACMDACMACDVERTFLNTFSIQNKIDCGNNCMMNQIFIIRALHTLAYKLPINDKHTCWTRKFNEQIVGLLMLK
ncbi:hypothetical protein SNEBB_002898 [Seison nebaliae]|nr:hypothetical protein SNEBB_002898 [Seison nebaliae]